MINENFDPNAHEKPSTCSTCGKPLVSKDGDESSSFLSLSVYTRNPSTFLKNLFGPYEIKNYAWCAECVLQAMRTPIRKEK